MKHKDDRLIILWTSLGSILIGTMIGTMGNSLVSIALPSLMDHFGVSLTSAVWSITVYTLTFSVLIPVFGVIGPAIGYKRLYLGGVTLICISSLLCVLAPNFTFFLIFRVLLGIGVATVLPTVMGIIANQFPLEMQGQATGYWAFVNSFGHAIGPVLGGLLLQYFNWQAIFLINIPLGLISILMTIRIMPQDRRIPLLSFDIPGAIALTGLAFGAIFAITQSAKVGLLSPITLSAWGLSILCGVFLLFYEKKIPTPFVNPKLFSNLQYIASVVPISLQAFSQFGLLVSLPIFLIDVRGMDKQLAGLIIMIMTLTMALFSAPFPGRMCDKWGSKKGEYVGNRAGGGRNLSLFGAKISGIGRLGLGIVHRRIGDPRPVFRLHPVFRHCGGNAGSSQRINRGRIRLFPYDPFYERLPGVHHHRNNPGNEHRGHE